jgi:hypothetical protein
LQQSKAEGAKPLSVAAVERIGLQETNMKHGFGASQAPCGALLAKNKDIK